MADQLIRRTLLLFSLTALALGARPALAVTPTEPELPGTVVGILVQPGHHPWGDLREPGTDDQVHRFLLEENRWAPYFQLRGKAGRPSTLKVLVPGGAGHLPWKVKVDLAPGAPRAAAKAAGLPGIVHLVELEVNEGRGAKSLHFLITGAKRLDGNPEGEITWSLDDRLAAMRRHFDGEIKKREKKAGEQVIYSPTWRPEAGRVDVLFALEKTAGTSVAFAILYRIGADGGITPLEVHEPASLTPRRQSPKGRAPAGRSSPD